MSGATACYPLLSENQSFLCYYHHCSDSGLMQELPTTDIFQITDIVYRKSFYTEGEYHSIMKSYTTFRYPQKTGTGDMGVIRYPQTTRTGDMGVAYTFTNLKPCINDFIYVMGVIEIAIAIIFYYSRYTTIGDMRKV